ncbi:4a-hydroxytetrahydrobiopterin dehydratase [Marmoricola sp. OAE513]|uniref:4a-hydroxytetrahydrobiopterin dehydratase n=1 Tax=Marmoricola sp. OAE513 TaxID=2817894 RepID=UPI001AE699E0
MVLSPAEVDQALTTVPEWTREGEEIVRTVEAPSFLEGLDLVAAVGRHAEEADHHPDIDIRWRTLTFRLITHSAGGLTEQDFELARTIDGLL